MKRGKLAAFSLTEVMVVLALTGMVVTIAFYVWYNFESFGTGYRTETQKVNEWNALDFALRTDANASEQLRQEGGALRFWKPDSIPGPQWQAFPDVVLRSNGLQSDTFHLPHVQLLAAYRQDVYCLQLIAGDSLLPDTLSYPLPMIGGARKNLSFSE